MRKKVLVLLGILVVLAAGVGVVAMLRSEAEPGISRKNCEKIQPGMSELKVEAILGGPGYVTDLDDIRYLSVTIPRGRKVRDFQWWDGNGWSFMVAYDESGLVWSTGFYQAQSPSLFDGLRLWLGL